MSLFCPPFFAAIALFSIRIRGLHILHLGDCQALIQAVADPQARDLADRLYPERDDLVFVPVGFTSAISRSAAQFVDRLQVKRVLFLFA